MRGSRKDRRQTAQPSRLLREPTMDSGLLERAMGIELNFEFLKNLPAETADRDEESFLRSLGATFSMSLLTGHPFTTSCSINLRRGLARADHA